MAGSHRCGERGLRVRRDDGLGHPPARWTPGTGAADSPRPVRRSRSSSRAGCSCRRPRSRSPAARPSRRPASSTRRPPPTPTRALATGARPAPRSCSRSAQAIGVGLAGATPPPQRAGARRRTAPRRDLLSGQAGRARTRPGAGGGTRSAAGDRPRRQGRHRDARRGPRQGRRRLRPSRAARTPPAAPKAARPPRPSRPSLAARRSRSSPRGARAARAAPDPVARRRARLRPRLLRRARRAASSPPRGRCSRPAVQRAFGGFAGWRKGYARTVSHAPGGITVRPRAPARPSGSRSGRGIAARAAGPCERRFAVTWRLAPHGRGLARHGGERAQAQRPRAVLSAAL